MNEGNCSPSSAACHRCGKMRVDHTQRSNSAGHGSVLSIHCLTLVRQTLPVHQRRRPPIDARMQPTLTLPLIAGLSPQTHTSQPPTGFHHQNDKLTRLLHQTPQCLRRTRVHQPKLKCIRPQWPQTIRVHIVRHAKLSHSQNGSTARMPELSWKAGNGEDPSFSWLRTQNDTVLGLFTACQSL